LFDDRQGYEAKIHVDLNAQPRFCKAQPVPFAMTNIIKEELTRLQNEDIITLAQFSHWAPLIVLKSDNKSIGICNDFNLTVNQASKLDKYPLPKIEDLFTNCKLAGVHKARLIASLSTVAARCESRMYAVINTYHGLFQYCICKVKGLIVLDYSQNSMTAGKSALY
jgi:hypothetical protein